MKNKRYIIVFDDYCGVCSTTARGLMKTGLLNDQNAIELSKQQDYDFACNVDPIRACDEMAAIDAETKEVYYGIDAYCMMLANKYAFFRLLERLHLVKYLLQPLYIFIAANRRIIAPIKTGENTCEPTLKKPYRIAFLLLLALFSVWVTYQKGELLHQQEMFSFINGNKLIAVTGLGWLITAVVYKGKNKWDYWGHLAMIAGTAIFLQFIALQFFSYWPSVWLILGTMGLSDVLMLMMHYSRMRKIGESQKQTLIWWLTLHLSAACLLFIFWNFN